METTTTSLPNTPAAQAHKPQGATAKPITPVANTAWRWAWGSPLARVTLLILGLLPFLRLAVLAVQDDMGANPIEFMTRSTGTWALVMLCLTLSITPLRQLTGWNGLIRHRRMLGLFVMFYAGLHALIWFWLDQNWEFASMGKEILKRPFVTAGMFAFLCLIPLAVTSNKRAIQALGRRWQRLHRLVYLIAIAAILHYWWHKAGKHDFEAVSIYGAVVVVLLGWRVWKAYGRRVQ